MKDTTEIIKEKMTPEEFEKAQSSGLVFKNKAEAEAAAAKLEQEMYEMQLEQQLYFEADLIWNKLEKQWREEELAAMSKEEKTVFLEKEHRRNMPENVYWSAMLGEMLRQAEIKKRLKRQSDFLLEEAKAKRLKKIEDQLTMKPTTN